jgi:transposase
VGDAEARVAFANAYLRNEAQRLLFSDEKYCSSNDGGSTWQWIKEGERVDPRPYEKWAAKLHVWGVIGIGVKRLVFLPRDERVNSATYLRDCIVPNLRLLRQRGTVLMQDGAKPHTCAATMTELRRLRVATLHGEQAWPARSPDLNPIERLWAILAAAVGESGAATEAELQVAVQAAWDGIPQSTVNALVHGFEPRLRECVRLGGALVTKV